MKHAVPCACAHLGTVSAAHTVAHGFPREGHVAPRRPSPGPPLPVLPSVESGSHQGPSGDDEGECGGWRSGPLPPACVIREE